jgi:hypothetical protein
MTYQFNAILQAFIEFNKFISKTRMSVLFSVLSVVSSKLFAVLEDTHLCLAIKMKPCPHVAHQWDGCSLLLEMTCISCDIASTILKDKTMQHIFLRQEIPLRRPLLQWLL